MKSINSKRKNKKKGFTLIEILAVIIIIGIIAIIGVVSVSDYIEDSRKSTYIQQASTYIEAARKLKSSDKLLQDPKNTEALLIPLTSLDLDDSHDYETPYGSIDLNRSYVLITNNNGNYSYYISMIDTTNHSLTVEKQENLNKNNIKTNDDNTIKSIISIKNEVETVDIDGFIYQKSSKNIENSSTILLDCNILDTFKVEVTEAWQNHDKEIKITTINNVSGYQYYLSTRSAKPLKSDANWQKENIFIRGEGHYYAFIKSDEDEISEGKLVIVKNIDMNLPTIKSLVQTPTIPTNGSVVIKGESFDKESGIIGYQFSTNGNLNASSSGWTKVTNSKETLIHNYTVTVNGTYYYYVKDEAGNVAKKSITVTNIDKNAPTIKSLTINPEGWTANDVTITGKSIDTESGIVAYQFSGNGNLNASSSGWTNITNTKAEVTHTYTVSLNGIYYYYVKDAAGNFSKQQIIVSKIDTKKPETPTLTASDGITSGNWHTSNFTISASGSSSTSGITYYYGTTTNPTTQLVGSITAGTNTSSYTYYVKACNGAGTCSNNATYTVKLDKTTPTVTISATKSSSGTAVSSGSWSNEGLNFKLNSGTVGVSGATIYYCKDTTNTCNPTTVATSGTTITSYNTTTGTYYLRYKIVSGAGTSSAVASYTAKVDTTTPTATISATKSSSGTAVGSGSWSNEGLNFKITAATYGTSGAIIYYCKDTTNTCNPTTGAVSGTSITSYNGLTGTYYIRYKIVSGAGKSSAVASYTARVDKTSPTVTISATKSSSGTAVSSGSWSNEGLNFKLTTGTVGGSGGTIYYCKDTTNTCNPTTVATSGTTITSYNTTTGTYYIRYKIVSGAGTSSAVASYTAKVDTTTPTATISATKSSSGTAVSNGSWSNEGLNFKITASSYGTSGAIIYYCKDTTNTCNPTTGAVSGTSITSYNGLTGTYYIRYKIVSGAGKSSAVASYTARVDKTSPTVTISATKSSSETAVSSGSWSNEGLNFKLTTGTVGGSGGTIYYCKDTTNTCNPTTVATSGSNITSHNGLTGTYYIRYKIVSGAGISNSVASYTARVDKTAPTISYNLAGGIYNANKTLTITASDTSSGVSSIMVHVYKDGTLLTDRGLLSQTSTNSTSVNMDSDGVWTVYTIAYDNAGNKHTQLPDNGAGFYYQSYTIDKTVPTLTISATKSSTGTAVSSGSWSSEGLNFKLTTGTVGISGATIYYCKDTANTCNPTTVATSGTAITGYNGTTGTYYIRYKIVSGAGNSSTVASYTAKVDTKKPETPTLTASDGIASGNWHTSNFTISASGSSSTSGITYYYGTTTNPTTQLAGSIGATGDTSSYTYYVKACNGAGICSNNASYTIKLDKTTPTATITATKSSSGTAVSSGSWSNEGLNFKITASSYGTSGAIIYYCKDTTNTCNPTTGAVSGTSITSYNGTTGTYYIRYKVVGGAGKSSAVASYTARVDKTPPTISYNLAGGTYNTNKTVVVTPNDVGSGYNAMGVHVYKDNQFISSKSTDATTNSTYSVTLDSDGVWAIYTMVYDNAGNKHTQLPDNGAGFYYQVYTIDTTKPSCTLAVTSGTAGNNGWYRSNVTIGFSSSTDNLSGVNSYGIGDYSTKSATLSWDTTGQTYTGYIKDNAGNTNTCSITVKRDTTVPTVGYSLSGGYYNNNQTVTVTANDANFSYMNIQVNNSSGVVLQQNSITTNSYTVTLNSESTWTVYVMAYDAAGNKQTTAPLNEYGWTYQQYVIDKTPPTVSYSLAGGSYTVPQTVTVNAADTGGSGFNYMNVHVYKDGAYVDAKSKNSITSTSYNVTMDSTGSWTIYAAVYDKSGNTQTDKNAYGWYYQSYTINPACERKQSCGCESYNAWQNAGKECVYSASTSTTIRYINCRSDSSYCYSANLHQCQKQTRSCAQYKCC